MFSFMWDNKACIARGSLLWRREVGNRVTCFLMFRRPQWAFQRWGAMGFLCDPLSFQLKLMSIQAVGSRKNKKEVDNWREHGLTKLLLHMYNNATLKLSSSTRWHSMNLPFQVRLRTSSDFKETVMSKKSNEHSKYAFKCCS